MNLPCPNRFLRFKSCRHFLVVLMAVVCGAGTVRGDIPHVYWPSGGEASFQGGMVAGVLFKTTTAVTFNSLGFIDVNAAGPNYGPDGLLGSYQVGIWLVSSQQLLASTTVTPASPLLDGISSFRYAPIPTVTIPAGEEFIIGALLPETLLDAYLINNVNIDSVGIMGAGLGRSLAGNTLSFPTEIGNLGIGAVGIANASTAVVPEPTSVACMVLGLGCLAMFRLRRKSA